MCVYLDLVFLLNFAVDFLLLLGTNQISGYIGGSKSCAWAAILGGIYGATCLIPDLWFLGNGLWRTVFLVLVGVIAFGWNRSALRRIPIFLILSMALGGIAAGTGSSLLTLGLRAGTVWLLCRIGFAEGKGSSAYIPAELTWQDRTVKLLALRDTGNTLRDPMTGEQVLVCGADVGEELLGIPRNLLRDPVAAIAMGNIPGLRLIPYHTVGKPDGMMLAVRLKKVVIGNVQRNSLVAFAPDEIGKGQVYRMLTGGII